MKILWPGFLLLLGLVPVITGIYIWLIRRRRRFAVRYSSLSLLREAVSAQSWLRRHLPFVLLIAAVSSLAVAAARPQAVIQVPTGRATIILAIDVSRSMCSTDIPPNRLEAAKKAALSFVQQQETGTQIGIVAFAGFAALVQPPTADQKLLKAAIENLTTARRTAIGSAILASLDAIAEIDDRVAPIPTGTAPTLDPPPMPEGQYAPHIVVLLTDGVSNSGMEPVDAARMAVDRRVRVYTIGFGKEGANNSMNCGNQFGERINPGFELGQQFGGWGFRRGIDEQTLKQVASMTGAEYYSATSAGELQDVFHKLPVYLDTQEETSEISFVFAAAAALFVALAIALSLMWHPLL